MIARMLTLATSVAGGLFAAQLPEFSQQYVQRLGGAVDALTEVVADFDASARAEGLTREAALTELEGTDFLERRQQDMRRTFARHARLSGQLDRLESAPAATRVTAIIRAPDRDVAQATYAAFRPAVPTTSEGLLFGGGGFLASLTALAGIGALFRRRRTA